MACTPKPRTRKKAKSSKHIALTIRSAKQQARLLAASRTSKDTTLVKSTSNHYAANRVCSVTMHPLGLLLTALFHAGENGLEVPADLAFPPMRKMPNMRGRRTANHRTATFKTCLTDWIASKGSVTNLADSLMESMNAERNDGGIRKNHVHANILAHRTSGRNTKAALLIEVGLARYHSLTITDQAVHCAEILSRQGLLVEPMLMVLIRVSTDDSTGAYLGAHLVVFLVIPEENRDFRMAPLWRENPRTPKELAGELVTIMEATELVTDWNRRKLKVANYEYRPIAVASETR
jgi:hypothetical protein